MRYTFLCVYLYIFIHMYTPHTQNDTLPHVLHVADAEAAATCSYTCEYYIYIYVRRFMYVYVGLLRENVRVYIYTGICKCVRMYIHMYTYMCVYVNMYIYITYT